MRVLEWLFTGLGFGFGVGFAYILISWFALLCLGIKDRIVKWRKARARPTGRIVELLGRCGYGEHGELESFYREGPEPLEEVRFQELLHGGALPESSCPPAGPALSVGPRLKLRVQVEASPLEEDQTN